VSITSDSQGGLGLLAVIATAVTAWFALDAQVKSLKLQNDAFQEQVNENRAQNARFVEQLRNDREQWRAERREEAERERKERAPFLAPAICCNPCPLERRSPTDHGLPTVNNDPQILLGSREANGKLDEKYVAVATILNAGGGAAVETRIDWRVTYAILSDGTELSAEARNRPLYEKGYLWPKTIAPGETAEIRCVPGVLSEDVDLRLYYLEGVADIECHDLAGEPHHFEHRFNLRIADPSPPANSAERAPIAWALFHFNEMGNHDGPFPSLRLPQVPPTRLPVTGTAPQPHSVTKPVTPDAPLPDFRGGFE